MSRCQRECRRFEPDILLHNNKHTMYRVYYTNPNEMHLARWQDISDLTNALQCCEYFRSQNMLYVTMVSDYADMVGKPGVKAAGSECIPQMLNP